MAKKILITGGAGFIGSHLADELLERGYSVRVFDNLTEQVHGSEGRRPDYLHQDAELMVGDVRNSDEVERALTGIDAVFHLAAAVGVGQSMYQIADYVSTNNLGTAVLLENLIRRPVEKLIVASSMSIYGEGLYLSSSGTTYSYIERSLEQLRKGQWEVKDSQGIPLTPIPTPESKQPNLASVYALSKYDQERMALMVGKAYGIPTVALRFFNVYGPRQALSNPYTGVLAIFASQLLNNESPVIFEDGNQKRDFVSVYDIAKACRLALETDEAAYEVFNIGNGAHCKIRDIADRLIETLSITGVKPKITGTFRVGDTRHCFADITKAQKVLGYQPDMSLEKGLIELTAWLKGQKAVSRIEQARRELVQRGLSL